MATSDTLSQRRILKQATEWFVELQSEHCNQQLHRQFEQWLDESPSHQHAYQEVEQTWGNLDNLKSLNLPELNTARSARPRQLPSRSKVFGSLLLAAIATGWWQDHYAPRVAYQTGKGEHQSIVLADGSHLQLNTATQLTVRLSWLRREIELQQGEAMFHVAHKPWQAFNVYIDNLQISDLGTVFNVRRDNNGIDVAVLEGEVELRHAQHWFGDSLKAGFSRRIDKNGRWQKAEPVDASQTSAWTEGKLIFKQTPLYQVVAELERYHDVHFLFSDPSLSQQTLSGSFDAADLNPFLQAVEKVLPIKVQRQKQRIVLSKH